MRVHDPIYICTPFLQHSIGKYLTEDFEDFKQHIQQLTQLMQRNFAILKPALEKALGWQAIEPSGSMYAMFRHNAKNDMAAVLEGLVRGVGVGKLRSKVVRIGLTDLIGFYLSECFFFFV